MVKIFTTNWCPLCVAAKRLLKDESIKFDEINIEEEDISREKLKELSGKYTVPQIFINNKCIGGYRELLELYQNKKLIEMINERT